MLRHMSSKKSDLTIKVRCDADDWADLSYYGEFTDNPDGAIQRETAGWREYQYFKPAYDPYHDLLQTVNPKNPARRCYGKKTARQMADQQMREDLRLMERYGIDWAEYVVTVTICWKGIEIGFESIGGVALMHDHTMRNDIKVTLRELIIEAYADAKRKLKELNSADRLPLLTLDDHYLDSLIDTIKGM